MPSSSIGFYNVCIELLYFVCIQAEFCSADVLRTLLQTNTYLYIANMNQYVPVHTSTYEYGDKGIEMKHYVLL